MSKEHNPLAVYRERLDDRKRALEVLRRRDGWCANGRLAIFVGGLGILWFSLVGGVIPTLFLAAPVLAFVALVIMHERILREIKGAEGAVLYYQRGIDRIEDRWAGHGRSGEDLVPEGHIYAEDLDLFGEASLFELLCTAGTRAGEATMAQWLCAPAGKVEIEARQQAVSELRDQLDFREELALLAGSVRARVRPELLGAWATAVPVLSAGPRFWVAVSLLTLTVAVFVGWAFDLWSLKPFILIVAADLIFARLMREEVARVIGDLDEPMKDLVVFSEVVRHFEAATFEAAKLCGLRERLTASGMKASSRIAQLARLVIWLDAHRNQMFAPIALVLLWSVHFAYALERWRARCGAMVPDWVDAMGELEVLCALAGYAYEHPDDPFPEITESEVIYDGHELGHPLLPEASCVRNTIHLGDRPRMLVVSGSNMSGKSTLLRVVGINAVLAFMGAPIRGKSLRVSPLALGASLHIIDSIQRGTSHFYAEITRLRKILELRHGDVPVLFLVDEILHGTNSRDRQVGAEAILKGFVEGGAIGLVTTHDLAITDTEGTFGSKAANVHFVDHLEGDRLVFDYKIREGVVRRSNALALMRAIGLKV